MSMPLLRVRDLAVSYDGVRAVDRLSFDVAPGEALALVGESGCGKSTTALALLGLLPANARLGGSICFADTEVIGASEHTLRALRGREVGMVFQEPATSLNPVHTIGDQVAEVLRAHTGLGRRAIRKRVLELLDLVAIPDPLRRIHSYPHELSGGQRQRVVIAMAIALDPKLVIADEPTTALDVTIQLQILELLDRLRRERGMSMVLISHDLSVVARWTDRVVVMHHGQAMERLDAAGLFEKADHPYTRGLISASMRVSDDRHYRSEALAEIHAENDAHGVKRFTLHQPVPLPQVPVGDKSLLRIENVSVDYAAGNHAPRAVDDVSLSIANGETLGLVGESGSGKTTLSRAVMRLVDITSGRIMFDGQDITHLGGSALRALRPHVQMVFQDPFASLNPRHTVGDIVGGVLRLHGVSNSGDRNRQVVACLDQVGLPHGSIDRYPHEFSGGQRQRIGIARALILRPKLVILDEPVSALDVSVQAQILNLLSGLKQEFGLTYLFISHDLAVVRYISDRIAVMKSGRIVEENSHDRIWSEAAHPFTQTLIRSAA